MSNCPQCKSETEVDFAVEDTADHNGEHCQTEVEGLYCTNKDCEHYQLPIESC